MFGHLMGSVRHGQHGDGARGEEVVGEEEDGDVDKGEKEVAMFTHEGGLAQDEERGGGHEDGKEEGPAEEGFIFGGVPAEEFFGVEETEVEDWRG